MNKKKMGLGASLLALVVSVSVAFPSSLLAAGASKPREKGSGASPFENPSFVGLSVGHINSSATPAIIATGPGLLYAVCQGAGTAGKYVVGYDYVTGAAGNPSAPFINPAAAAIGQYLITPLVVSQTDSTSSQHGMVGCWVPPWPVRFENSLLGYSNASDANALFLYRLTSGADR